MLLKILRKLLFDYSFFLNKKRVYILMFHKVNNNQDLFYKGMPTHTFYSLIDYLLKHFQIIHLTEISNLSFAKNKPYMVITFDDGMDDIRTHVFDYLMDKKVKFTCNIDTKILTDQKPQYFIQVYDILNQLKDDAHYFDPVYMVKPIYLNKINPYETELAFTTLLSKMTNIEKNDFIDRMLNKYNLSPSCFTKVITKDWIQNQKENSYIHFGSHSHSHPIFSELSSDQIKSELHISRTILEDILEQKIKVFAYPNGESEKSTDDLIQDQGFEIILKTGDKLNDINLNESTIFYRINMYHQCIEMAILQAIGLLPKLRILKSKIWN